MRGLLKAESLIDGTVDLELVATLNDAMDVEDHNLELLRKVPQ
jgi:hypothetical protein